MKLYKHNCGLAIMRIQPLHFGHIDLLGRMIEECRIPVLAIGSAQESRTYGNPFTFQERKKMVQNYPGLERLVIVPIKDIFNLGAWARYALDTVEKKIKNKVNIYYCGTDQDGVLFLKEGIKVALTDRTQGIHKGLSASLVRKLILSGSDAWRALVPSMNHPIVTKIYGGKKK